MIGLRSWQAMVALIAVVAAAITPLAAGGDALRLIDLGPLTAGLLLFLLLGVAIAAEPWRTHFSDGFVVFLAAHLGAWQVLRVLPMVEGDAGWGFWALVVASWLLAWRLVTSLSLARTRSRILSVILKVLVPFLFGVWLLFLWEVIVRGFGVSPVLLPPPSAIWAKIARRAADPLGRFPADLPEGGARRLRHRLPRGFLVAILADRVALPEARPPPGRQSRLGAADRRHRADHGDVVRLRLAVEGRGRRGHDLLPDAGEHARRARRRRRACRSDLMRTYAASHGQTLVKLRLPAALPFIFNAFKINSTLAMIGAIVAEFFGTPIVGMGFRISTEVGRMNDRHGVGGNRGGGARRLRVLRRRRAHRARRDVLASVVSDLMRRFNGSIGRGDT